MAGGSDNSSSILSSAELYDPATGRGAATGSLGTARAVTRRRCCPTARCWWREEKRRRFRVPARNSMTWARICSPDWQPLITTAPSPLGAGEQTHPDGSRFQGISEASGGNNQNSSTNYPLVQLRALDMQPGRVPSSGSSPGWSDTSFTSTLGQLFSSRSGPGDRLY